MQDIKVGASRLAGAEIGNDVGLLLAKMHVAGSLLNNRTLGDFGLRERSFWVLTLACSGLEPTQRELAIFLGLDPSQVVSLVDDLERRGWWSEPPASRTGGPKSSCQPRKAAGSTRKPAQRWRPASMNSSQHSPT